MLTCGVGGLKHPSEGTLWQAQMLTVFRCVPPPCCASAVGHNSSLLYLAHSPWMMLTWNRGC